MNKKRLILIIPAMILLTLCISTVYATPSTEISGKWKTITPPTPVFSDNKFAGANAFITMYNEGQYFEGPITGTFMQYVEIVYHFGDPAVVSGLTPLKPMTWPKADFSWNIERTFTATVNGASGTLTMHLEGKGYGKIGAIDSFEGTWVIVSGTDGLANLHGQGTWQSALAGVNEYQGQIHFE